MKKKFITITLFIIVVLVIGVAVYFAYFKVDAKALAEKNISEMDKVCFTANNGMTQIKLISGTREDPYLLNGKSEKLKDFALIVFRTDEDGVESPTFTATINDKTFNGILEQNPYDNTFVVDLEQNVQNDANVNIKVTINNDTYNYDLVNTSKEWSVSSEQVKDIAVNYFMPQLQEHASYKGLDAEMFVRIISDNTGNFDKFFYHVTLNLPDGKMQSIIIDINSGEIIK